MKDKIDGVTSNLPCVIKTKLVSTDLYIQKGWTYYHHKPLTDNIDKARVFRSATGARNALRGSGLEKDVKIVELREELTKTKQQSVS
jgi:hypothetical protein